MARDTAALAPAPSRQSLARRTEGTGTVRVLSTLALGAAVGVASAPAHASCTEAPTGIPPLAAFDHVVAGSVTRTTQGGAAAVDVTDVWHGPDLPPEVVVVGGQLSWGAGSSVDRTGATERGKGARVG